MDKAICVWQHNSAEVDCTRKDERVGGSQDGIRDLSAADVGGLDELWFRFDVAWLVAQDEANSSCGEQSANC